VSVELNPARALAAGVLALSVFCAVFAVLIAPHSPTQQSLTHRFAPPLSVEADGSRNLLGTDNLGRDVLSRMIYGAQISLTIGFLVVILTAVTGTFLGLAAGLFGGVTDQVIMRVVDIFLAVPFILLAIAVVGVVGPSLSNIVIVLTITSWPRYTRVIRARILSLREMEFIVASRVVGAQWPRVMWRHLLPNVTPLIIVVASLHLAGVIIAESSLSFLGLGVQPPTPTWGSMLSDGRNFVYTAWWLTTFPGLALSLTVLSVNLIGDWLRDVLDPRFRV